MPGRDERGFEIVSHAVEGLELVGAGVDSQLVGDGHGVSTGPDVVRGERGCDDVNILEESDGEAFEARIAFGFVRPDRGRPIALLGDDGFIVPIGAFDQTNGERALARPSPFNEGIQIRFRRAQVSLQRDAHGGLSGEFLFFENGAKQRQGQILELIAFHIEIDEGPYGGGATENGAKALFERGNTARGVSGIHLGGQRRHLYREIQAGQGDLTGLVTEGGGGGGFEGSGHRIQDADITREEDVGLGFADDRFTEEIDGGGHPALGVSLEAFYEIGGGFTGHKLAGEVGDLGFDRLGHESGGEGRGAQSGFQRGMEDDGVIAEVLLEVAHDFGGGTQRGQDIDEAKELGLERGIAHGPLHEASVGPGFGQEAGSGMGGDAIEEIFADGFYGGLQRSGTQGRIKHNLA